MSEDDLNSEKFLERLRNREREAWDQLCEPMLELLFPFIFKRLGRDPHRRQDAEDLVQETLIRAFQKIGGFNGRGKIKTWICNIARCLIADYFQEKAVSPFFRVSDIRDAASLAVKLRSAQDSLSEYLKGQFSADTQRLLKNFDGSSSETKLIQRALAPELNRLLRDPLLFDKQRLAHLTLSDELRRLIQQSPHQKLWQRMRLNRWLLEEVYPREIIMSRERHFETLNISELSGDSALIEKILGADGNLGIVDQCEKRELLQVVESAINDWLEKDEIYLLMLRYVYELTESEIAEEWRCPQIVPVGTVTATLMRVQKKLRRLVA